MNNLESLKTCIGVLFLELLLGVNASEKLKENGFLERTPVCTEIGNEKHCYFLVKCIFQDGWSIQDVVSKCQNHVMLSTVGECWEIPLVSGVAIDTPSELKFIKDLILSADEPLLKTFTSGYWSCKAKMENHNIQDFCGIWQEWNSLIPKEILKPSKCKDYFSVYHCPSHNETIFYNLKRYSDEFFWNLFTPGDNETENIRKNPKDETKEWVYIACEYEIIRYGNCPMTTDEIYTSAGTEGVESSETSETTAVTEYMETSTSAGTGGFETSETSEHTSESEYSISTEEVISTQTDCGQFTTEGDCTHCQKIDDYGSVWQACSGEVVNQSCPNGADGYASWRCGMDGFFTDDKPDYQHCHSRWISDLEEMVEQQEAAEKIIDNFLWDSHEDFFFGHEISQLVEILFNTSIILQNQADNYNETFKVEEYKNLVPKLANITNNIMRKEKPWDQINMVSKALCGSKLQEFLNQIGFTLINTIFAKENQNQLYLEYSYSNLKLGMQLSSPIEPTNHLVINYPKDFLDNAGSIAVYGEIKAESDESPTLIASVGTIIDSKTGKRLYPEKMKSWVETSEMLLNSAVISFEFQSILHNTMDFGQRKTEITPLKINSVILKTVHAISARGPSKQLIRRSLFAGESPTAVLGHAKCVFWNNSSQFGRWDESGCKVISTNESLTTCNCTHLSSFGVFMSIHKYEDKGLAMELLSWICSGLSIICLILTLSIFQLFKANLQGERETICRNICSCLLVTHILSLTVLDKTYFNLSDASCTCIGAILHYILSSGFLWMAAEGHHLYRLVLRVMDGTGKDHRMTYYIVSYGLSLLIVGLTATIGFIKGERAYGNPELCWLSLSNYQWSFISQALLIPMVNTIVLIMALRAAVSVSAKSSSKKFGIWLRGWFTLSSLLGVTWFFGIATFNMNMYFEYIFVALNGLQGVTIFISRIIQNEQVWSVIVRRLRKRALLKSFYMNTNSENSSSYPMSCSRNLRNRDSSGSQLWNIEEESNPSSL